jgi:hypothetical protein
MQMPLTNASLRRLRVALSVMIVMVLTLPWPTFADASNTSDAGVVAAAATTMLGVGNDCPNAAGSLVACISSPPVLSLPGSIVVEATTPSGAAVSFTATASDANPIAPTLTCTPSSGSTFRLGTNVVSCSATGASGMTANGSFTVQVQDTRSPTMSQPADITSEATGPSGAQVAYPSPPATDLGGPANPTVTCTPASGSMFPLGTTSVKCSATDSAGNTTSATFNVTIVDAKASSTPPADQAPGRSD